MPTAADPMFSIEHGTEVVEGGRASRKRALTPQRGGFLRGGLLPKPEARPATPRMREGAGPMHDARPSLGAAPENVQTRWPAVPSARSPTPRPLQRSSVPETRLALQLALPAPTLRFSSAARERPESSARPPQGLP